MDFNDFRLFVMPESLPSRGRHGMESSPCGSSSPSESRFSDVCLTEDVDGVSVSDSVSADTGQFVVCGDSAVTGQNVVRPKDNTHEKTHTDWSLISECPGQAVLEPLHDREWSRVSINDDGDIEAESLSPACLPDMDDHRMSKSLDLGHDELGAEMMNSNSLPWQSKARTLDSPHKTSSNAAEKTHRKQSTINDGEKIKFKLMSAWNNMKFGMKPKTSFRVDAPIWLLGMCYNCTKEQTEREHKTRTNMAFEHFKKDFISKIWFTYRQDFPVLAGSQLTTDVGWGCMLRTGQMMLAHALVLHFLRRDWRWHAHQKKYELVFHQQIIKFFGDSLDKECPFSIHRLVQIGAESGKKPGDWYGPASVAFVLREAVDRAPMLNALLSQICLYVAQDCTIYKQDVMDLCCPRSANHHRPSSSPVASPTPGSQTDDLWRAVIVLIPVRLGGEVLNPIYISCVSSMLAHDLCVGIIGGRPKHSLYFIGWQEDKLIHLDPHLCQDRVDVRDRKFPLQTFHCMSPRKMSFSRMDPSCTIGFYCRTKADFFRFVQDSEQMASPPKEKGQYPMYVFQDGRSTDLMTADVRTNEDRYLRVRRLDRKGRPKGKAKEADDFVFL